MALRRLLALQLVVFSMIELNSQFTRSRLIVRVELGFIGLQGFALEQVLTLR